jgi:DNA-directed RNA polymerase specialized sigma24 family protein
MKKNWALSQDSFDALIDWLDSDRAQAGLKYEQIRRNLIKIFINRRCEEAEDLADETINRVVSKLDEVKKEFTGDPARYFYGVANKIFLEFQRKKPPEPPSFPPEDSDRVEREYRCLEHCMNQLFDENRELLLLYHHAEGRDKIERRKWLADKLGISPNALRIKAFRIRIALQKCVKECLEKSLD